MTLPPPPPVAEVLKQVQALVLPAAGGAALAAVCALALSRRLGFAPAAVGAVAGLAAANWKPDPVAPWWPAADARAWEWLGPAAVVLAVVGVPSHAAGQLIRHFARRPALAHAVVWLPRLAAAVVVGAWLLPAGDPPRPWRVGAGLGVLVVLHWLILDAVARAPGVADRPPRGNRSAQVVLLQAVALWLASGLCLYAHSGLLCDLATAAGAALFGVAVVGFASGADVRGAVPVGAVVLPGLAFLAHETTTNVIPPAGFWLAAVAPLGLAAWLAPALHRRDGWAGWACRWAVVVTLAAAAVVLAGRVETLPWEGEDWGADAPTEVPTDDPAE